MEHQLSRHATTQQKSIISGDVILLNAGMPDLSERITSALKRDDVALVQGVTLSEADDIMLEVSNYFELSTALELQAAYAGILGHRRRASQYFMTVNQRADYQFVKPHSEGTRLTRMNLAALYCLQNSTDGGETLLFNVNPDPAAWMNVKELVTRLAPGSRPLSVSEMMVAKVKYRLNGDILYPQSGVVIISKSNFIDDDISILNVLTPLMSQKSAILERDVYSCWDSVSAADYESINYFYSIINELGIFRRPRTVFEIEDMEASGRSSVWRSGVSYEDIFTKIIIRKLKPGDLIIQNNMTWAHATSNWTPGTGVRRVLAAFA